MVNDPQFNKSRRGYRLCAARRVGRGFSYHCVMLSCKNRVGELRAMLPSLRAGAALMLAKVMMQGIPLATGWSPVPPDQAVTSPAYPFCVPTFLGKGLNCRAR